MKNSLLWLGLAAVLIYLVMKSKAGAAGAAPKPGALPNTGTAATAPAPWLSTLGLKNLATAGTASTVGTAIGTTAAGLITSGVSSIAKLFGGSGTGAASGTVAPTTSGSGSGVVSAATTTGDTSSSSSSNPDASVFNGFDTYTLGDFAGPGAPTIDNAVAANTAGADYSGDLGNS